MARDVHRALEAFGGAVDQPALQVRLGRERDGVQQDVEPAPAGSQRVEKRWLSGTLDVERQKDRRLELAREARRRGFAFSLR